MLRPIHTTTEVVMTPSKIPRKWLAALGIAAILLIAITGAAFAQGTPGSCDGVNPNHIDAECRSMPAPTAEPTATPAPATATVASVPAFDPLTISGSEEVCRTLEVRYDYEAHAMVASEAFGGVITEDSDMGQFVHTIPFCIMADWHVSMTAHAEVR